MAYGTLEEEASASLPTTPSTPTRPTTVEERKRASWLALGLVGSALTLSSYYYAATASVGARAGTGADAGMGADLSESSAGTWLRGLGITTAATDLGGSPATFGCFTVVGDDDSEVEMCGASAEPESLDEAVALTEAFARDTEGDVYTDCSHYAVETSRNVTKNSSLPECFNMLWPMPVTYLAGGERNVRIASKLSFKLRGDAAGSDILLEAVQRYIPLILSHGVTDDSAADDEPNAISEVVVSLDDATGDYPTLSTDESYQLVVPSNGHAIVMHAATVYGALHALETLSQLVRFDPSDEVYRVTHAPIKIHDEPRFHYRGLMVDTARHFIPIKVLEKVVDTMAYSKLNVLHLHLSDQESFPFQSLKFPDLWSSAFSDEERFTQREMRQFVKYAHMRGVAVLPEFDTPAHSKAMCKGVPEAYVGICMDTCEPYSGTKNYPLRPIRATFSFLKEFLEEFLADDEANNLTSIFPFELYHTGGDEAKTKCYEADNATVEWCALKGMNASSVWPYFVNTNAQMVSELFGRKPIAWNDAYTDDGNDAMDPSLTFMWWTTPDYGEQFRKCATEDGHKVIAASGHPLYLSLGEYGNNAIYEYDPCDCENLNCVNTTEGCENVLGMSTAFWTSDFDASNLLGALFPRAIVSAERMWSSPDLKDYTNSSRASPAVTDRLGDMRCRLLQRGVPVLPIYSTWDVTYAGSRPGEAGSCMNQ